MPNKDAIAKYGKISVPLYASYPTEQAFNPISAEMHAAALRQIDSSSRVSVYLHIPYCKKICHYCICFTKMTERKDVVADYVRHLIADIKLQASYFSGKPRLRHLHWGGGTPSIVGLEGFRAVMKVLHDVFTFEETAEQVIELDPRHTNADLCRLLAEQGINRISIGVQDTNPKVQEAVNRIQPLSDVARTVADVRSAGINQINFDLICGLPLQTRQSLQETCEAAVQFKPNRITYFRYLHAPQQNANQKLIDSAALPDVAERYAQSELIEETLKNAGYIPIGLENFVLPEEALAQAEETGELHRNFQGYTDDSAAILLGFGAYAISQFPDLFVQNIAGITRYKKTVAEGQLPTLYGAVLNDDDKRRGAIISDLLCRFQIDLTPYGGVELFQTEMRRLKPLIDDQMLVQQGNLIAVTPTGKPFARVIASLFDKYYQQETAEQNYADKLDTSAAPRKGLISSHIAV